MRRLSALLFCFLTTGFCLPCIYFIVHHSDFRVSLCLLVKINSHKHSPEIESVPSTACHATPHIGFTFLTDEPADLAVSHGVERAHLLR